MNKIRAGFLAIGTALLVYLIWRLGPEEILVLISSTGWNLLTVAGIYLLYQIVRAAALVQCAAGEARPSLWSMFSIRVAGEAVQYLTFTGPFLAEPAKAWLLRSRGFSTEGAFAATLTEYLSYTFTSAAFSACALAYLLAGFPLGAVTAGVARVVFFLMLLFLGLAAVAIWRRIYLIGYVLQGVSRLPFIGDALQLDMARVRGMEDLLLGVFRDRPRRFIGILALEILAQFLLVLELHWILRSMNLEFVTWIPALIEGAGKFVSLAFFFVPTQVGAAEGTYVVIVQSVGLPATAGLALSLIRRLRSLLIAGVGLAVFWVLKNPPTTSGRDSRKS